jgi:C1A family cysteine protease
MPRIYNLVSEKQPTANIYANKLKLKFKSFNTENLPTSVDLRSKMPPVMDQGDVGSCTACSVSAAFQFCDPSWDGSAMFLYYNTRMLDNSVDYDNGSTLSQSVNAAHLYGLCSSSRWPYNTSMWRNQPNVDCYVEGLKHQTISYSHVDQSIPQMKGCLASGFPYVIGFYVYESFESPSVESSGNVPMPQAGERILGGHAIVVVGYDDSRQVWICRNSWGPTWGDAGYFYMPYAYLDSENLATDVWRISSVELDGVDDVFDVVDTVTPIPLPIPQKKRFKVVPKLKSELAPSDVLLKDLLQ